MFKDMPISNFLDALASKSATPGGGSAAAIMGAMGAALGAMETISGAYENCHLRAAIQ